MEVEGVPHRLVLRVTHCVLREGEPASKNEINICREKVKKNGEIQNFQNFV